MKIARLTKALRSLSFGILAIINVTALGQTAGTGPTPSNSIIPIVNIRASDPLASWLGNPGVFTVSRAGNPQPALNIYYQISGTASNGLDYQQIGNFVQIASGVASSDIVIKPINHGQTADKTVTLTLAPSPLMTPQIPVNYIIGNPSNATVLITSRPLTNVPPVVNLAFPTNGSVFYTPLRLPLIAAANDPDGKVVSVEFFENGVSLGVVSNTASTVILPAVPGPMPPLPSMPPFRPFVFIWTNVPAGTNILLSAKATDDGGASTLSDPVSITVHPGPPPPPPTNVLEVRITSPANGAIFHASLSLPIFAFAADIASAANAGAYVTGVEFFAGSTDLGPGHRVTAVPPPLPPGQVQPPLLIFRPTNYWELLWTNVPVGAFALTAMASDSLGHSAVSDAVNVTILPPPPPPPLTNVVNITAIDPVAIEGTNCWPWLGLAAANPTWANWTASSAVCRYFTNCGPKNAVFAVRRFGPTNTDLAVTYNIGGTATNGVDYVSLPGTVTINAGEREALITVMPIDDGAPDITSTVVLKLAQGSGYLVGKPAGAAAIILDRPSPVPVSAALPDRCFHLSARGPDGAWFHVECTGDLLNWTPVCTNQVVGGSIDFVDADAGGNPVRFYRAMPEGVGP